MEPTSELLVVIAMTPPIIFISSRSHKRDGQLDFAYHFVLGRSIRSNFFGHLRTDDIGPLYYYPFFFLI